MTEDMMDLQAMVGKSPDADFLPDMIGFAAKRLMELEVGGLTGAGYGEKDAERLAQFAVMGMVGSRRCFGRQPHSARVPVAIQSGPWDLRAWRLDPFGR